MTEKEIRKKVATVAAGHIGLKEANGGDDIIIKKYNEIRPAGGYKMGMTDPWCAAYASVVGQEAGCGKIIPIDCSCDALIKKFKALGDKRYTADKNFVPQSGDYIFYDWDPEKHNGSEHVGIVETVSGKTITVIEGNKNDASGRRTVQVGYDKIEGYGLPDYASIATKASKETSDKKTKETTTEKTYTVKHGDSLWSIADAQLKDGTRFHEIKVLNGLKSTIVHAGQVLKLPIK